MTTENALLGLLILNFITTAWMIFKRSKKPSVVSDEGKISLSIGEMAAIILGWHKESGNPADAIKYIEYWLKHIKK